jgi:uncharacterized protein
MSRSIAMRHRTRTPEDLAIPVRDLHFSRKDPARPRWWHHGDPVPTAFFNALSCTFPAGEKFFMDSVRRFRREAPEPLRSQIAAFLAQEAVHSREHGAFNALAADSGYDIAKLEGRTKVVLDRARTRADVAQLAGTCALEHFTAILAHHLLSTDGAELRGAPDEAVRLWCWHAMEEVEHKAVAFDTFLMATQSWSRGRRYRARIRAMLIATATLSATHCRQHGGSLSRGRAERRPYLGAHAALSVREARRAAADNARISRLLQARLPPVAAR